MSVAVVMMVFFALSYWDHAAMRRLTHSMLKLNRRMVDTKVVQQPLLHVS